MKSAVKGLGERHFGDALRPGAPVREVVDVPEVARTPVKLGGLEVRRRFFLAPLAGVSDWPFRVLARAEGAPLAYTEMVSAEGLVRGGAKTIKYLERGEDERPFAVQLFGARPHVMAEAARAVRDLGADLVDVNMGCPVKKVCRTGAGSALLQDPSAVAGIVEAMAEAVDIPVQIKVRTGWDADTINVVEVARAAREAGASAIAIHGRTRAQAYEGTANWDLIAEVKAAVDGIAVIGNGDVVTAEDAIERLTRYGVDAVMIGRVACGYPWIFRELDALVEGRPLPPPPTYAEWRGMIRQHLENLITYRDGDEGRAVREFRKHLVWYSRGRRGATSFRKALSLLDTVADVERCLDGRFPETAHHELRRDAELVTGPLNRAWG